MRRTATLLLSLFLGVSVLAACGGDDDDTTGDAAAETETASGDDPAASAIEVGSCPTADDVGTALGYDATGPDETDAGVYLQCLYEFESDALDDELVVGVAAVKLYPEDAASSLEIFRDVADDETEASGYGDEAWYSADSLFVRIGDQGVEVTLSGLGSADDGEVLTGVVARLAIG